MTIHYHGTPISPISKLLELKGRFFCVSFIRPDDIHRAHAIGQGVMLDNGAYSVWRREAVADWPGFYAWADRWLDCSTTWAIIPDSVTGGEAEQDALVEQWPHGDRGAPVWHMHEGIERLLRLLDAWPLVCMGSSASFAVVLSDPWRRRMDEAWNAIVTRHRRTPRVHMLRGMATLGRAWPFHSVDSTDIGRNHNSARKSPRAMADRWDAIQCPIRFQPVAEQMEFAR